MAFLAWSLLARLSLSWAAIPLHLSGTRVSQSAKPTKELGWQPGLRVLGSERISDFVHFGLVLASSSVLAWEPGRGVKNRPNLPLEAQACSTLLAVSDILRRQ